VSDVMFESSLRRAVIGLAEEGTTELEYDGCRLDWVNAKWQSPSGSVR
jgi:hypothetical protein